MIKLSEDLRRWFKEKWTAQDGSECGDYKGRGRVKCRPSKRISEKSPQTWGEMSPEEKKKAVRKKQEAHRKGKQFSSHKTGKIWDGSKNKYRPKKKRLKEMFEALKQLLVEAKKEKPYKGFKKGKNHPEGGLSRAEARRQGIHAGIETKDEAKRKGGFGKLSSKTQKRRKSFCARMCGMKKRRTSSKTANDPKSKINAALRVWGCRCGTNESYENTDNTLNEQLLLEKNKPTNKKLWSRAKALARQKFDVYPSAYANGWAAKWYKKKGGGWVSESLNHIQQKVKDKFLTEGCGCGGGNHPKPKPKIVVPKTGGKPKQNMISEEIVNQDHAGTMTKKEISSRDKIKKKLGKVRVIKKGDSPENAAYRLATYIQLLKRGKKQRKKKSK